MLVLSRQLGEKVMIGENIEVMVVGLGGGRVKLGIAAPRQVPVNRLEIYNRIHSHPQTEGMEMGAKTACGSP